MKSLRGLHPGPGWTGAVAALLLVTSGPAYAHLMADQHGTLNIVGPSVFAVLSVPVSALHDFDDNRDGLLSPAELDRHRKELSAELDHRLVLSDGDRVGQTVRLDVVLSPPDAASPDRADHLIALKHVKFEAAPQAVVISTDLFGVRDRERQLTITATLHPPSGPVVGSATLTPASSEHRFASKSPLGLALLIGAALVWLSALVWRVAGGDQWRSRGGLHPTRSRRQA